MGIPGWEADHVTLVLSGSPVFQEIQLLCFRQPALTANPHAANLARIGFNHVCFRVTDLVGTIERLRAAGVSIRSDIIRHSDRQLVLVDGPEGIAIELAEWLTP